MDSMFHCYCMRNTYSIPEGLRELMNDISREVLRSQPSDIYTYIADYLDALLITREHARVAARIVQSLTEMAHTTAMLLQEAGMNRDEIDNLVFTMHQKFGETTSAVEQIPLSDELEEINVLHEIIDEIKLDPEKAEIAAKIIQQAYRKFKDRKNHERQLMAGIIDWRVAARSAIKLYRRTGVTNEEANRAATLIKAAYKGYYTRRQLKLFNLPPRISLMSDYDIIQDSEVYGEISFDEHRDKDEITEEIHKEVKINYETVIPHVDFDTSKRVIDGEDFESLQQQSEKMQEPSTTSTIVKYSMKHLFDVVDKKTTKTDIVEGIIELIDELTEVTGSDQEKQKENIDKEKTDIQQILTNEQEVIQEQQDIKEIYKMKVETVKEILTTIIEENIDVEENETKTGEKRNVNQDNDEV